MANESILWRGIYRAGHEYAHLRYEQSQYNLEGIAVFSYEQQPCRLDYLIHCDSRWQTRDATVSGWVGQERVSVEILVDSSGRWSLNGGECHDLEGCIDIDLNFSPSTNLLPIRRNELKVGDEAAVKAAWLRFPSFQLEPLEQIYRRISDSAYLYSSAGGAFVAELNVNATGFVTLYPNIWAAE